MEAASEEFHLHEGRRLELKRELPKRSDLARTVVAFANDAGGELIIGIDNDRRVVGVPEESLSLIEESVSSVIYDRCSPTILPEISIHSIGGKFILRVQIFPGNAPPYYVKNEGRESGVYIRVGSLTRRATPELIEELKLKVRNTSFDGVVIREKPVAELAVQSFQRLYEEKTQEPFDEQALRKLNLAKEEHGILYPTIALALLSDDPLRESLFPHAKIECARFKGRSASEFIDQKTITGNIALQPEQAYDFILRHINRAARVQGVYTVQRWEYPVNAIREALRNAVVHRQYSLSGADIKVAVYDDMVEITSPGLLPPGIDYAAMESRQSDARNRVIAPVFKKLGIIDQWGNGLRIIAEEMRDYPEISFKWQEVGLSFQVQFVRKEAQIDEAYRRLSPEHSRVLAAVMQNDRISVQALSAQLHISKRRCDRMIEELCACQLLRSEGKTRSRRWIIP